MEEKKVFIGCQRYRIVDESNVNNCFKCGKFGHSKNKCRENTQRCLNCAGEHHIQQCKEDNQVKCAACVAANTFIKNKKNYNVEKDNLRSEDHKCGDRSICETYIWCRNRQIKNTDYPFDPLAREKNNFNNVINV